MAFVILVSCKKIISKTKRKPLFTTLTKRCVDLIEKMMILMFVRDGLYDARWYMLIQF